MPNNKIKNLKIDEKPREKLIQKGPANLSDTELLAIIIRSGGADKSVLDTARELLSNFSGLKNLLEADFEQLRETKNIGVAKATALIALKEICLRYLESEIKAAEVKSINKPEDVYKLYVKTLYNKKKEELHLISLDSRNNIISKDLVSIGTVNETLVHPREVYKLAISKHAASVILLHNHPSGDTRPSDNDISVTKRLAKAGILLGISLIDHIIITNNSFCSLKTSGFLAWDTKGGEI